MRMTDFGSILVAVDGSDPSMRAVDAAISLAAKYDCGLTALYVIHIPFGERLYPRAAWYEEFIKEIHEETRGWSAEIQKKGKENGVVVNLKMSETIESVSTEITRYAKENKTELIVVGSRGKSDLEKLFLGSVAAGVLAYALCPVLVVR
jgi:nucleotide-binding universal stress UspA family protein